MKSNRLVVGAMLSHCSASAASDVVLILPNTDIYCAIRRNKSIAAKEGMNMVLCDVLYEAEHRNFVQMKDSQSGRNTGATFGRSPYNCFLNPTITWIEIKTFLTRQKPSSCNLLLEPDEGTNPKRAINLFTISAATHLRKSDEVSSKSVGLFSKLVLVNNKSLKAHTTKLHYIIKVLKGSLLANTVYH